MGRAGNLARCTHLQGLRLLQRLDVGPGPQSLSLVSGRSRGRGRDVRRRAEQAVILLAAKVANALHAAIVPPDRSLQLQPDPYALGKVSLAHEAHGAPLVAHEHTSAHVGERAGPAHAVADASSCPEDLRSALRVAALQR